MISASVTLKPGMHLRRDVRKLGSYTGVIAKVYNDGGNCLISLLLDTCSSNAITVKFYETFVRQHFSLLPSAQLANYGVNK